LLGLLAAALGFAAAQGRSATVAAPLLTERFGPAEIVGRIEELERLGGAARLTLAPLAIEELSDEQLPALVRLRVAKPPEMALPGAVVRLTGVLLPPPGPAMPGGYDFAREAFFRGLGAVGFAFGAVTVEEDAAAASGWSLFWSRLRSKIGLALRQELEGDVAAVAEALLTGERAAISEPLLEAYRDSGLAHLLSISGLHISLVAGLFFFSLRAAMAAVPVLALNFPIKKWAAAVALAVLPFYAFLVGASVPTLRASLMLMLVLLAVLLDRRAISLRLVAWAAPHASP
jgi:competence protein ComEC